jgi:hypothetical protein
MKAVFFLLNYHPFLFASTLTPSQGTGLGIGLLVSLTMVIVKTGSLPLVLLLQNGSNLYPLFNPGPLCNNNARLGEAELRSLLIQ